MLYPIPPHALDITKLISNRVPSSWLPLGRGVQQSFALGVRFLRPTNVPGAATFVFRGVDSPGHGCDHIFTVVLFPCVLLLEACRTPDKLEDSTCLKYQRGAAF